MFSKKFQSVVWLTLALVAVIGLAACSPTAPEITIEDAWGRPSPMVATTGAFYMNIVNTGGADRLVSANSESCGTVELHESVMGDNGVMSMRPLENGIEIPSGQTVELKPGGMHVMCIEKKGDFTPGAEITLSLDFENFGTIILGVEIREP